MTTLRPFFSYYGSKWRLAPKYPEPKYDTIIEPFAGSAGYSLHYPEREVILVERDPIVAAVWRWLIQSKPDDILSLPRLKRGERISDYDVPQEAQWLMGLWVAQAQGQPRDLVTKFGASNGDPRYDRFALYPPRVASQLKYIRHWQVITGYHDQSPCMSATWFIDPPYQVKGHSQYRFNAKTVNYPKLADWCRARSGQVIVCENEGANWLPFEFLTSQQGFTDHGKVNMSVEVVWKNESQSGEVAA